MSTGELEKVHAEMEALFQQHPHLRSTYKEHHQQHMKKLTRYNAIKDIGQKVQLTSERIRNLLEAIYFNTMIYFHQKDTWFVCRKGRRNSQGAIRKVRDRIGRLIDE